MGQMRILKTSRTQGAWLWDNPVPVAGGGFTYDAPVHILVRWEERSELFIDEAGEEVSSRAIVAVGQRVKNRAMLMRASDYGDSSGAVPSDPYDSALEAWPVRGYRETPTLGAKDPMGQNSVLRECIL